MTVRGVVSGVKVECSTPEKLEALGEPRDEARWEPLRRLAKVTALKQFVDGTFGLGNWWRGPLLYSLVQRYRPRHILEFGTGRGYGTACMAQAALDADFECTVWTVDRVPPTRRQAWAIDEGDGPVVRQLALNDVWTKYLPREVIPRIRCLTGDSMSVMQRWRRDGLERIDFCFIDGGHDYWTVKHDFIASLQVANPGCAMLFDDYTMRHGYGVKRLIDQEVAPRLPAGAVEILDTLSRDKTVFGEDIEHYMALIRGEAIGASPLTQFYSRDAAEWLSLRCRLQQLGGQLAGRLSRLNIRRWMARKP